METQHVYSRSLAGLLLLVALVALSCGGCGETVSKGGPVLEPVWSAPCLSNSDEFVRGSDEETLTISDEPSGDMAEAGVLGYSDPAANEGMPTPSLAEDEGGWEPVGDTDAGSSEVATPWRANWGEDRMEMINEEPGVEVSEFGEPGDHHNGVYEETPCTPPVTEQEYTPEPTDNTGQEYTPEPAGASEREYVAEPTGGTEPEYKPEPTSDPEPEYMQEPAGDGNDAGCDAVGPCLDSENETTTGGNCSDVSRYEADLPSALPDGGTSESGTEPEPGPGP